MGSDLAEVSICPSRSGHKVPSVAPLVGQTPQTNDFLNGLRDVHLSWATKRVNPSKEENAESAASLSPLGKASRVSLSGRDPVDRQTTPTHHTGRVRSRPASDGEQRPTRGAIPMDDRTESENGWMVLANARKVAPDHVFKKSETGLSNGVKRSSSFPHKTNMGHSTCRTTSCGRGPPGPELVSDKVVGIRTDDDLLGRRRRHRGLLRLGKGIRRS